MPLWRSQCSPIVLATPLSTPFDALEPLHAARGICRPRFDHEDRDRANCAYLLLVGRREWQRRRRG